ncbi:MAG TPA: hypothetical protein PLM16_00375 [Candidatus Woesebacteria bacterium]|nr:hypothetical protein [Candidatus Woesebacteria bacterium]
MLPGSQNQSTTQDYLDVYDITNNLVILKSGVVSLVLSVGAMNFGLLAEAEQDAVIYTYAALLNSLNYPIQILVQSQAKDVTDYLNLLKQQEEAASSDHKRERIQRYRQFVSEIIRERNVLDKKFYTIVPASPSEIGIITADSVIPGKNEFDISKFEKSFILEKAEAVLEPRRDHLVSQFARIGLYSRQLETQEIIRIFYTNYNPEASEGQELTDTNQYTTPLVRASLVSLEQPEPNQGFQTPSATSGETEPTNISPQDQSIQTLNTENFTQEQTEENSTNQQSSLVDKKESASISPDNPPTQKIVFTSLEKSANHVVTPTLEPTDLSVQEQSSSFSTHAHDQTSSQKIEQVKGQILTQPQTTPTPQITTSFQENLDEFEVPANLSRRSAPTPSNNKPEERASSLATPFNSQSTPITSPAPTPLDTPAEIITHPASSSLPNSSTADTITNIAPNTTNVPDTFNTTGLQPAISPAPQPDHEKKQKILETHETNELPSPGNESSGQLVQTTLESKQPASPELDSSLQTSIDQVLQQVESPNHMSVASPPSNKPSLPSANTPKDVVVSEPVVNQGNTASNTIDNLPPIAEIE